jgi:hypothetical protein
MTFLSLIPLAFGAFIVKLSNGQIIHRQLLRNVAIQQFLKLFLLSLIAIGILSYWIVPALLADKYHNFSFWDPIWKFNSYGAKETIIRLFNGDLFDFGRLPIYTGLAVVGFFILLTSELAGFAYLLIFFLALYFGRTTWGDLINLIPSMKEFHLSRFIVGVHLAGLFLAPIGLTWLIDRITIYTARFTNSLRLFVYLFICLFVILGVYPQTIRYAQYNDVLINQANNNYAKQIKNIDNLRSTIQSLPPGRVFAGRGGSWGKNFRIAETPMYIYLSNFAIPTVLWLPETWSPSGDTEQYFREDKVEDYALYTIHYVVTPANLPNGEHVEPQPFWKPLQETSSWKLYEVPFSGYFSTGIRPATIAADKYSRANVERLWIQSDDPKNGLYPQLTFDTKNYPQNEGLPNFKMLDEVTFQTPDMKIHNLFTEPPRYVNPTNKIDIKIIGPEKVDADMIFSTKVDVGKDCTECIVVLKQTFHPNWKVTVDGELIKPITVFPFYIGIPVAEGTHTIVASYEPSSLKIFLLVLTSTSLVAALLYFLKKKLLK